MHFKKLLTMFTITFFASSGTMLSINTHVSNNKLIDLTFDNLGNVYATEMSGQLWKKYNNKNYFFRFQLHPLSNSLISIVINNDNCIYVGNNTGNLWKSYRSSTFVRYFLLLLILQKIETYFFCLKIKEISYRWRKIIN